MGEGKEVINQVLVLQCLITFLLLSISSFAMTEKQRLGLYNPPGRGVLQQGALNVGES